MIDGCARLSMAWAAAAAAVVAAIAHLPVSAHEARPAYLELTETLPGRYDVVWRTPVSAGLTLPVVLRFPDEAKDLIEPRLHRLPDSVVERRIVTVPGSLSGKRIDFVGLARHDHRRARAHADARWGRFNGTRSSIAPLFRHRCHARGTLRRSQPHTSCTGSNISCSATTTFCSCWRSSSSCRSCGYWSRQSPPSRWHTRSRSRWRPSVSCTRRYRRRKQPSHSAFFCWLVKLCVRLPASPASPRVGPGLWRSRSDCCTVSASPAR